MRINFVKVIDVLVDEDVLLNKVIGYLKENIDDYIDDELCEIFAENDIDPGENEELFESIKAQLVAKIIVKKI